MPRRSPAIVEKKLPCGGARLRVTGTRPKTRPKRGRRHYGPISDKRHFAGVKAHDTRLKRKVAGMIGRVQRNVVLKRWKPVSKALLELATWLDDYFDWGDACKIGGS